VTHEQMRRLRRGKKSLTVRHHKRTARSHLRMCADADVGARGEIPVIDETKPSPLANNQAQVWDAAQIGSARRLRGSRLGLREPGAVAREGRVR